VSQPAARSSEPVAAFAHPVERELARLFDDHGVEWEYEPHTFVLERNRDGSVREAFTPDFFLPGLGIYVECTVMRQSLTARKRSKVRRARERAGIDVHVLFRRDISRLAERWQLHRLAVALERDVQLEVSIGLQSGTSRSVQPPSDLRGLEFGVDEEHPRPGTTVLAIRGEADLHVASELRDRINEAIADGANALVLDLSETTFVDSMTLGVLLGAMKRLRARGGQLQLVVTRPDLRRIFEITLLDRVLPLHATRDEALDAVDGEI